MSCVCELEFVYFCVFKNNFEKNNNFYSIFLFQISFLSIFKLFLYINAKNNFLKNIILQNLYIYTSKNNYYQTIKTILYGLTSAYMYPTLTYIYKNKKHTAEP